MIRRMIQQDQLPVSYLHFQIVYQAIDKFSEMTFNHEIKSLPNKLLGGRLSADMQKSLQDSWLVIC